MKINYAIYCLIIKYIILSAQIYAKIEELKEKESL